MSETHYVLDSDTIIREAERQRDAIANNTSERARDMDRFEEWERACLGHPITAAAWAMRYGEDDRYEELMAACARVPAAWRTYVAWRRASERELLRRLAERLGVPVPDAGP